MQDLQTLGTLLLIYGALWLANTVLGIRNSLSSGYKFEWSRFWDGVLKAVLGGGALTVGAVAISFLPEVLTNTGIVLDAGLSQAVSLLGVLASVGAGVIYYAQKFVKNITTLFSGTTSETIDTAIVYDENDPNKGTIVLMDKTGERTDRDLMIEKLLASKTAKDKGVTTPDDVKDGTILSEEEAGKGSGDTYPSYWKNVPKDSVVDRYTCYNRECVSYAGWKVEEAYGYILPRGGSMNAKEWVKYAGLWGVQLTADAGVGSVGVSTAGEYGHVFWVEEVHNDGTITVSEYNYAYNGLYNVRRVSRSGYRFLLFDLRFNKPAPAPAPTPAPAPASKPVDDAVVQAVKRGDFGNGADRKINLANAGYDPNAVQQAVNASINNQPAPPAPATPSTVQYTYKSGDTFGQVILNLGLNTANGLWGASGDVAYYTAQLHAQGIYGNIPVGKTITLVRRG